MGTCHDTVLHAAELSSQSTDCVACRAHCTGCLAFWNQGLLVSEPHLHSCLGRGVSLSGVCSKFLHDHSLLSMPLPHLGSVTAGTLLPHNTVPAVGPPGPWPAHCWMRTLLGWDNSSWDTWRPLACPQDDKVLLPQLLLPPHPQRPLKAAAHPPLVRGPGCVCMWGSRGSWPHMSLWSCLKEPFRMEPPLGPAGFAPNPVLMG